jgi:hypothetical protein
LNNFKDRDTSLYHEGHVRNQEVKVYASENGSYGNVTGMALAKQPANVDGMFEYRARHKFGDGGTIGNECF